MLDFMMISPAMASSPSAIVSGFMNNIQQFMLPVLLLVVFYLFLIRPQQKKARLQRELLSALSKGDQVLTSGGMIGRITKLINDEEVMLEISPGVEVRMMRSTITQNLTKMGKATAEPKGSSDTKKKTTTRKSSSTKRTPSKKVAAEINA